MYNKKILFILGLVAGLIFAPVFFFPGIFAFSLLARQIKKSYLLYEAALSGYIFGFGFFLSSLYWVSFSIFVYMADFWWALPFALLGLPAFLALFCGLFAGLVFYFRFSVFYQVIFCVAWVFMEWCMSWAFTGFPWAMLGYGFAVSKVLSQSASVFGVIGLSFIAVYIGSSFYEYKILNMQSVLSALMLICMFIYGDNRLKNEDINYSEIKIRVVQPSIVQSLKWDMQEFEENLNRQIWLTKQVGSPDIIIWPESALIVSHHYPVIAESLKSLFSQEKQFLVTGAVSEEASKPDEYKIYTSMIGLNKNIEEVFSYYKSHLVPFGEYMPFREYIPIKKLTHGSIDYSQGERKTVEIEDLKLRIYPLICYESIFYNEININHDEIDVIFNITNDSWFAGSSGPYQHFVISRMRAIESGIPVVRAANNGISAIIDPMGRVLQQLKIDEIGIIDSYLPQKLSKCTLFLIFSWKILIILILLVSFMHGFRYVIKKT